MTTEKEIVDVNGFKVAISRDPDKPLMLLVRMAAQNMGLWDKIWDKLAEHYSVAAFNLPTPDLDKYDSGVEVFTKMGRDCVDVAAGLGYGKFHMFGWTGGAQVGKRILVDYPDRLISCVLMGVVDNPPERRPLEKSLELMKVILGHGDLELYTYFWLLSSFTPEYAENHFEEIKDLVDTRLNVDRGRLDTEKVFKWIKMMRDDIVSDKELSSINVPTLLVAPAFDGWAPLHRVRKLHAKIKTSQLAIIPGKGAMVLVEEPESFWTAAGDFIRAAAGCETPISRINEADRLTIINRSRRIDVVEHRADEAIVFLHGWLMSPHMWDHAIHTINGSIRTVSLWQPAHGQSTAMDYDFTMKDWAKWLIETLDSLNVQKTILVGHSMGGMLSMQTAVDFPERVNGLVLVGTQHSTWDEAKNGEFVQAVDMCGVAWGPEIAPQVADLLMGEKFLKSHPAWIGTWTNEVAQYDLRGMSSLGKAIAGREDLSEKISDINVPTLVAHGTDDKGIEIKIGRQIAQRIPGARFEEMPGAAHCPPLEVPELFSEKLIGFLDENHFLSD
jgi:pimeloyl-ACP methyl ester carboxylesterase